jgi:hypothetical protein
MLHFLMRVQQIHFLPVRYLLCRDVGRDLMATLTRNLRLDRINGIVHEVFYGHLLRHRETFLETRVRPPGNRVREERVLLVEVIFNIGTFANVQRLSNLESGAMSPFSRSWGLPGSLGLALHVKGV